MLRSKYWQKKLLAAAMVIPILVSQADMSLWAKEEESTEGETDSQTIGYQVVNGDFETGDFTGWSLMDGSPVTDDNNNVGVISNNPHYWGTREFFQQGDYFLRGESKESLSGDIRSSSFILGGDGYISFMIGAAAKAERGCIKLYEETGEEDTLVETYINENWSDPKTGNTLIRVFDKLDDKYMGKELYFVIENGEEAGFSFVNADDFRTSMTEQEVKDLQESQIEDIRAVDDQYTSYVETCYRKNGLFNEIVVKSDMPETLTRYANTTVDLKDIIASETKIIKSYSLESVDLEITINSVKYNNEEVKLDGSELTLLEGSYTIDYTRAYDGKSEDKTFTINAISVDTSVTSVKNGDFETGDLTGWTALNTSVWSKDSDGNYLGVTSAKTYWNEKLSYNQGGDYHLDGWTVTGTESDSWGVKSSVFTLDGSGYISVKMGGAAAGFKVYTVDGTLVGDYRQNRFSDQNFPYIAEGGSWGDMGTYFVDLSSYLGQALYIELWDNRISGGWAIANFDDVVTYYESVPDFENGFDTVEAPVRGEDESMTYGKVNIPWTLLSNEQEIVDLSFEDSDFQVVNTAGKKETAELNSNLKEPKYQDEAVSPYRPAGVSGNALNFDGYSNYVEFNEDVSSSQLTVDAYACPRAFMWDSPSTAKEEQIAEVIAGSYNTESKQGFLLGVTKHGYIAFRVGTGNNWYSLSSDTDAKLPLYEWSRVTGVFDGVNGIMRVYLNGELVGTKKIDKNVSVVASGNPIRIGKGSQEILVADNIFDGTMFPGLLDEITITKKAFTEKEIKANNKALPEISYDEAKAPASALAGDYYRPTYHAAPPANWMNEPHALFKYNGKWHLFYQTNQEGPYWHNISWGHWVSDDMVNWECVEDAVVPTDGTISPDGVWTGNVIYSSDGKPVLLITAGDDSRTQNGSNQHVGVAVCDDYSDENLTNWKIVGYSVAQTSEMGTAGEFRDAQAFGIGDDRYMVVGGANDGKGQAHVFKTEAKTLDEWVSSCESGSLNGMDWEYMGNLFGDFFENNEYKSEYGTVWEMPNLVPLQYEDGTSSGKYLFVFSPQNGDNDVWYYIGDFDRDTCRFTPDFAEAKLMDYGNNIFTGPTVYLNPEDGKTYICSVMQENATGESERSIAAHYDAGWAFYAGLPRELFLKKDGSLGIKNIDTSSVEGQTMVSFENKTVSEANELLAAINSDTLKIDFTIDGTSDLVGFNLKQSDTRSTKLYFSADKLGLDKQSGDYTRGESVSGTVYLDKCSIEAYIDQSICISGSKFYRGYGLSVFGDDNVKISMTVTAMNPIGYKKAEVDENSEKTGDTETTDNIDSINKVNTSETSVEDVTSEKVAESTEGASNPDTYTENRDKTDEKASSKKQTIKVGKKLSKLTIKRTKKYNIKKYFSVKGKAKLTFSKLKGNSKIILTKAGKLYAKKGLKAGTYKIKIKVSAKKTSRYSKATLTKTIKIKVK